MFNIKYTICGLRLFGFIRCILRGEEKKRGEKMGMIEYVDFKQMNLTEMIEIMTHSLFQHFQTGRF